MTFFERLKDWLYFEQWALMFDMSSGMPGPVSDYRILRPPRDRFWADPHVIYLNNLYYIFFEEYLYSNKKAHISVIVMDRNGGYLQSTEVLNAPYHLSYPFVFQYQDDIYMVPESCQNHTIELYKSVCFPYKWEFQMNLMSNLIAVDSTLHFSRNKWWLFANIAEEEGEDTWGNLGLFYSDELFTDKWLSHPGNPIVTGVDKARPAGALFTSMGKLYRPSQDSTVRYGHGFNINEIIQMDENVYSEKIVKSIKPDWAPNVVASHTFSQTENLSIVDAQIRRIKWL